MQSRHTIARGFTLIELLTVIAIIGILAAIIIPTVGRVRASAKTSSCGSQMRQVSMALILYQQENRGVLPATSVGTPSIIWQKALGPYLPLKGASTTSPVHQVFTCPSAEYNGFDNADLAHTYGGTGAIRGPGASGAASTLGSSSSLPRVFPPSWSPPAPRGSSRARPPAARPRTATAAIPGPAPWPKWPPRPRPPPPSISATTTR